MKLKCPNCGNEVEVDLSDPHCPVCGHNLENEIRKMQGPAGSGGVGGAQPFTPQVAPSGVKGQQGSIPISPPASGGGKYVLYALPKEADENWSMDKLKASAGVVMEIDETVNNYVGREILEKFAYRDPDRISRSSTPQYTIWIENDKIYIEDFRSANGTYIDGKDIRLFGPIEISEGKIISLVNPGNPVLKLVIFRE